MRLLSAVLVMFVVLLPSAYAQDLGLAGNWKVTIFDGGSQVTFWLIVFENKGGKLNGAVDPLGNVAPTTLTDARVSGDLVEFTLKLQMGQVFRFQGKLPKAGGKRIFGSLARGGNGAQLIIPAVMEATSAKSAFEVDREMVVRTPNDPRVFGAVLSLIGQAKENNTPPKEVQEWVDTALRAAENYGPRWQLDLSPQLVEALLAKDSYATIAADTARKAISMMDAKAPVDGRLRVLTALGRALKQAGKAEQAKEVEARLDMLEVQAHEEYEAKAQNFLVAKFPGRHSKSKRTALVELFTGAQCPPCVGADLAFDTLPRAYDDKEVVLLEYHLHVPRPDALTNAESEGRASYYGDEKIRGTPTILFNGKVSPVGGGSREDAEEVFKEYRKIVDPLLEAPAGAQVQATATRKGDKIHIKATATDVAKPGDKLKLRIALVEDWVRYHGSNGVNYHHQVVRAFPGGAAGLAVTKQSAVQTAVVDVEELRKSVNKYLDAAAKEEPFPDSQRPMRLKNLSVVAFLQDDATQEIVQATHAPVVEE